MPCDSIQTSRVKLAGNIDPGLLAKAMKALGVEMSQYVHDATREEVIIRNARGSAQITQAQIAQAYSGEVVKATAAKNGWRVKEVAPFKYQVTRGGI